MGEKTTIQDLLLMNYHGMKFSPILRTQWENYHRFKARDWQFRLGPHWPMVRVRFNPTMDKSRRRRDGLIRPNRRLPNAAKDPSPQSASTLIGGTEKGGRTLWRTPNALAQMTAMPHPQPDRRTNGRERVTPRSLETGCAGPRTCVTHTGMVTTADGTSAGDQFISPIPHSATVYGNRDR